MHRLDEITQRHGEPVTSFFARIAAHYGLTSARELALDFELDYGQMVAGNREQLQKLADITGGDFDMLVRFSPRSGGAGNSLHLDGQTISVKFSRRRHLVGCPDCWAQDMSQSPDLVPEAAAYLRLPWLFTPIWTCTTHDRPLLMVKEGTSRPQLYDTALMAIDLKRDLPGLMANGRRRRASAFEHYVQARLLRQKSSAGVLDLIGINEVFTVCGGIGKYLLGYRQPLNQMSGDQLHAVYAKGFDVLSSEPSTLSAALAEFVRRHHAHLPSALGPGSVLGGVYPVLMVDLRGDRRFEPIHEFLARAVFDAVPVRNGVTVLGIERGHERFHTVESASTKYGLQRRTVMNYAEQAGIFEKIGLGGRQRLWMDSGKADALFNPEGGLTYLAHLDRFGLKKQQATLLLRDGFLSTIVPRNGALRNLTPPIRLKDVTDLLDQFLLGAEPVERRTRDMIGLDRVSREFPHAYSLVHRLILSKKIWVGNLLGEQKAYASILVRYDQIAGLDRPGKLTVGEVAKVSGLRISMVKAMVEEGDLQRFVSTGQDQGLLLLDSRCPEYINLNFIELGALAKKAKRKSFSLLSMLETSQVLPVRTCWERDRNLRLYRRSDVDHLIS